MYPHDSTCVVIFRPHLGSSADNKFSVFIRFYLFYIWHSEYVLFVEVASFTIHLPSLAQFSTILQFIWLQSQIYVMCFARQWKHSLIEAFKSISS